MAQEAADQFRVPLWSIRIHSPALLLEFALDKSWVEIRGQTGLSFDSEQPFLFLLAFFQPALVTVFSVTNFRLTTSQILVKGFVPCPRRNNLAFWLLKFLLSPAVPGLSITWSFIILYWQFLLVFSINKFFLPLQTDIIPVTCDYLHNGNHLRKQTVTLLVHMDTQCFFLPLQIFPWIFTCKFGYMSDCSFSKLFSWELAQPEILSKRLLHFIFLRKKSTPSPAFTHPTWSRESNASFSKAHRKLMTLHWEKPAPRATRQRLKITH